MFWIFTPQMWHKITSTYTVIKLRLDKQIFLKFAYFIFYLYFKKTRH